MAAPLILRITTDQHSPFVAGYAGDPYIRTPNLDRLAASGTVFKNHYCANPVCVPGRYSMMTVLLPRELGTLGFWDVLPSNVSTYAGILAEAGYQTTCVGKMHFHGQDQMHGWRFRPYGDMECLGRESMPDYDAAKDRFREWRPLKIKMEEHGGYNPWMLKTARPGNDKFMLFDESVTREAILHLKDYFTMAIAECYQGERPLLFEVSYKTPHCPYICPPELFDYYMDVLPPPGKAKDENPPRDIRMRQQEDQPPDITLEMIRRSRAGYWGLVQWVDHQIGQVLSALEQLGLRDEATILYTSDHGEMAGERGLWQKSCFYEESVRVPMILSGPGIPQGKVVTENPSHLDLLPTLCDLAEIPPPAGLRGESLIPLLTDRETGKPRAVFSEFFGYYAGGEQRNSMMVKRGSWKWIDYCDGHCELFDLASDPDEQIDRANDPACFCLREELRSLLAELPQPWQVNNPDWEMKYCPPSSPS